MVLTRSLVFLTDGVGNNNERPWMIDDDDDDDRHDGNVWQNMAK